MYIEEVIEVLLLAHQEEQDLRETQEGITQTEEALLQQGLPDLLGGIILTVDR